MTYLLDTHVVVRWFTADRRLAVSHRRLLDQQIAAGERLAVSAITLWEIAMLAARGRIVLSDPVATFVTAIECHPAIEVLPLSGRIAVDSTQLGPAFPRDPADQIIAATARAHGLVLMTADDPIRKSGAVPVV